MAASLSPAKVVLLAAHFTAHADIESLSLLAGQRAAVLHKELLLRILLTFLPETLEPSAYVGFLRDLAHGALEEHPGDSLDTQPVEILSDEEASRKARKLHLLPLSSPDAPPPPSDSDPLDGPLAGFLVRRVGRIDHETGPMSRLPDLLIPFLDHAPAIRTWYGSTVLPYVRKNFEYHTSVEPSHSLIGFQNLPDRAAVSYLLSQTGRHEEDIRFIGRDLRGLIGPWLQNQSRWKTCNNENNESNGAESASLHTSRGPYCPGWEQVLEWLICQPLGSGTVSIVAMEQWDGPGDVDLGEGNRDTLTETQHAYLRHSYSRACLASAYLISEASVDTLARAYWAIARQRFLSGFGNDLTIEEAAANLPDMSELDMSLLSGGRSSVNMRNNLLQEENPLTAPTQAATSLLLTLITSAFICTRLGCLLTIKRAGDLIVLQDKRDQEAEVQRFIRAAASHVRGDEDEYWRRVRQELLWLRAWTQTQRDDTSHISDHARGIFGVVPKEFIESQILKIILSRSRCALARSIYEDGTDTPLPPEKIQEIAHDSSLHAFDNATNPNRSRGGLRKCDEIIHAFPKTMGSGHPLTRRVEALLRCTHALSDYRLVLKQGEPFSPVLLRVHSDPISIIEKVLEQNPKSYTRIQEFLDMASNMVHAGIGRPRKAGSQDSLSSDQIGEELAIAEHRIVAMCIEAALREDDFETAYSFVVSRLDPSTTPATSTTDQWSWTAALKAGQYIRSSRSQAPTHLGTASGNLEIRHLEQRIECLATALRIAPNSQLQEILKTFRRCEEQLDSAIKEDLARDNIAWEGLAQQLPGAFHDASASASAGRPSVPRSVAATAAAQRTEDAPMSLFDLSRATARLASRNLTRFSPLPAMEGIAPSPLPGTMGPAAFDSETGDEAQQPRQGQQHVRKRDQLREAATGTLVSSVGWLIGASPSNK